jgi:2-amino-4-hydroxy-6-hydroxymethyldihydropteridine diphosphokinase
MEYGLSLGSNLGDRIAHMREARRRFAGHSGFHEVARSPLYETEPVDVHPDYRHLLFVNAVMIVEAEHEPLALLEICSRIEREMGRARGSDRNAPRSMDIDILYAGDCLLDSRALVVPHPRWASRAFVVAPLADVRPSLVLPGAHMSVAEVLKELPDRSGLTRLEEDW